MKEYFSNINGGLGLDHWSPTSSSDMPLAKFITNYGYYRKREMIILDELQSLELETLPTTQLKD